MSVVTRTDDPTTPDDETGQYAFIGIGAGTYVVRERVPTGYEQTFPNARESEFHIEVDFPDNTLTPEQQAVFVTAAARWSEIILGDVPDVNVPGFGLVDDVVIVASGPLIDGPGGILGQAGPTTLRTGIFLPAAGIMQFDSADIAALIADGQFDDVILHEMGHVLGFGTIWDDLGLITGVGTTNARFTGASAAQAYSEIFGITATTVPVESDQGGGGTLYSHWDEATFDNELMTGFLNDGVENPISRITVGQMADLGYEVNMQAADDYTPPALRATREESSPPLRGRLEILDVPRTFVDAAASAVLPAVAEPDVGFWTVELADGEVVLDVDFGNRPFPSSISGRVWNDRNADGVLDATEPGLPNWTVFLDEDGDGQFDHAAAELTSTDVPAPIVDFVATTSKLTAPALDGNIVDVNVTLDITHTYDADLRITLISPAGTRVLLTANDGGAGDDFDGTTFDDQAPTGISRGAAPFAGSFRPRSPLAALNGELAAGEWQLEVADQFELDVGTLNSWSLTIVTGERSVLTNSAGQYEFADLTPGEYVVGQNLPSDWAQTFPEDPLVHVVTLGPGQDAADRNFGNSRGFLGGQLWNDYSGDGVRDPGEPPLASWQVYLDRNGNGAFDNSPTTIASTDPPQTIPDLSMITSTIDVAGISEVSGVDVTVTILHPYNADLDVYLVGPTGIRVELFSDVGTSSDNFVDTQLSDEAAAPITSGAGPFSGTYRPEGSLAAFDGLDPNGVWTLEVHDDATSDIGELQGWSLTFSTQEPVTVSDELGNYGFDDLPPGTFIVREIVPAGWAQTHPAAAGSHSVELAAGQVVANVDFGAREASIAGYTWHDQNGDGVKDAGEPGLPGWNVYFDGNGNGVFDSGVTTYAMAGASKAILDLATITSTIQVTDHLPIHDVDVALTITHSDVADLDVHLVGPTGVRVELFTDVNSGADLIGTTLDDEASLPILGGAAPFAGSYRAEGALAAFDGDDPFGTWTLEVTDDAGNDVGSLVAWSLTISSHEPFATTGADGYYAFYDLPPGGYRLLGSPQSNWEATAGVDGYNITLAAGELRSGVDFGERLAAAPGDFDRNTIVDGGDFLLWQRTLGAAVAPGSDADADGDGNVTGADLAFWTDNFDDGESEAASVMAPTDDQAGAAVDAAFASLEAASLAGLQASAATASSAGPACRPAFRPLIPRFGSAEPQLAPRPRSHAAAASAAQRDKSRSDGPDSEPVGVSADDADASLAAAL
jgi:subtilisin-like proprotein convertase family protein